jgi:hypothetical protein
MAVDAEISKLNRHFLNFVRHLAQEDPGLCAHVANISRDQAEVLSKLPTHSVDEFAAVCDRLLMTLSIAVSDLHELVTLPPPVASLMASTSLHQTQDTAHTIR